MDGFDLKVLIRTLVMPPALPLLLLLAGLLLLALTQPRKPEWRFGSAAGQLPVLRRIGSILAGLGFMLAYLLSIGATANLLGAWVEQGQQRLDITSIKAHPAGAAEAAGTRAKTASAKGGPRAVIILGGGTVRDGVAAPDRERLKEGTLQRVLEGARIARGTGLPVLVSGGIPIGLNRPEAHVMRDVLQEQFGVSVRWVEDQSRDTADNARMSATLLRTAGISEIVLVTHAYHMTRARLAFEAAGFVVTAAPHDFLGESWSALQPRDFLPRAQDAQAIALCLHELLGRLWYRWQGHA